MDETACVATMAFGMEAIAGGTDLLGLGEMGIGNTTIAAAIYAALYGGDAARLVGPRHRASTTRAWRARSTRSRRRWRPHAGHLDDPLEVLRRLGGREIAAMAGAILAARLQRVPVVLDGYVVDGRRRRAARARSRGARPLHRRPRLGRGRATREVLRAPRQAAAARSRHAARRGHRRGARPWALVKAAVACHRDMATFAQAGVSDRALTAIA